MTPAQQYEVWSGEFVAELKDVNEKLLTERPRSVAAESAYTEARASVEALLSFGKDVLKELNNGVALLLHSKLSAARDVLKELQGERGAARASVKSLETRAIELREAIAHIDMVLTSKKVTELRPKAASSRPKPPLVEFDNISIPMDRGR